MTSLIITFISIALTAMLVVATVQYMPGTRPVTEDTAQALRTGLQLLEQGILAERRAAAAVVNTYVAAPQALTGATFRSYVIVPKAPGGAGSAWSYGTTAALGSAAYVCLDSKNATEAVYRGLKRVKLASYSDEQMTISTVGCGAATDSADPASFPAADVYVTYYIKWQG